MGFNKRKKGQRSYYPLFCTIAQTGQVFDVWHRPGNVHDSNGAKDVTVHSRPSFQSQFLLANLVTVNNTETDHVRSSSNPA